MATLEQLNAVHEEAHAIIAEIYNYKVLEIIVNTIKIDYGEDDNIAQFLYFIQDKYPASNMVNDNYIITLQKYYKEEVKRIFRVWLAGDIGEQFLNNKFNEFKPLLNIEQNDHYVVNHWCMIMKCFNLSSLLVETHQILFDNTSRLRRPL